MDETWLLRGAVVLYMAAAGAVRWRRVAALAMVAALALHTLSLAGRWQALGHGPFTTMHEILSSSVWSLALVFMLSLAAVREVRMAFMAAAPVWLLLAAWMLVSDPRPGHLPPTYDTPLLYLHTLVGKLYLGLLLVSAALGGAARWRPAQAARLDELSHRFSAFAFVFDTLMLIVGAAWAQDAWGRYWAWDPLETWAFVSWLALAAVLHARGVFRPSPALHGLWLAGVFVLAFLTFFGVPFIATAPHKGAL